LLLFFDFFAAAVFLEAFFVSFFAFVATFLPAFVAFAAFVLGGPLHSLGCFFRGGLAHPLRNDSTAVSASAPAAIASISVICSE
jgi:hypothetical protein